MGRAIEGAVGDDTRQPGAGRLGADAVQVLVQLEERLLRRVQRLVAVS